MFDISRYRKDDEILRIKILEYYAGRSRKTDNIQ